MNELIEYVRNDGHCPFAEWFKSLDDQAAAKVAVVLDRMKNGNFW